MTEGVTLAAMSAALGLVLGITGIHAVRQLPAQQFPRIDGVSLDARGIAFTVMIALATGLVCGLAPAWRVARLDMQTVLRGGARQTLSGGAKRMSDAFVVGQFALSLVLLAVTGLLLRSYQHVLAVRPGFQAEGMLTARVGLPFSRYGSDTLASAFYDRLLRQLSALPGIRAAAVSQQIPLTDGNQQSDFVAEGAEGDEARAGGAQVVANSRYVSPDYFTAMGTPLLRGRAFRASDDGRAPRVAVVDETFAAHHWPGADAIGQRFRYGGDTSSARWITVVGIVPNVKHTRLDESPDLQVYEPAAQRVSWINYVVMRVSGPSAAYVAPLRRTLAALDPTLPLYEVHTMTDAVNRSLGMRRLTGLLFETDVVDWATVAAVASLLGATALVACWLPARRAMRVDPIVALHAD